MNTDKIMRNLTIMKIIEKPKAGEFAPYASMYIDLLPDDGLVLKHLKDNFAAAKRLVFSLPEERLLYRYAPEKWSIKEILVHIIDDERIYVKIRKNYQKIVYE